MVVCFKVLAFNQEDFDKAKNYLKCQNCDLSNADFSKLILQGIDLEQSNLTGVNFSNSDLSIAVKEKFKLPSNLVRVNLKDANFSNADLTGVNFEGSYIKNVNFNGAILTNANFVDAVIKDTSFNNSEIDGATFSD